MADDDRLPRWHPATLVAAAWAVVAIETARRGYRRGLDPLPELPPVPKGLPAGARRGVVAALARRHQACLVTATVLQAWDAAQGRHRELVIGVTAPSRGFRAHAWLEGDPACHTEEFTELLRRPIGSRAAGS